MPGEGPRRDGDDTPSALPSRRRFPLLVQFEFHPASAEAAAIAEYLRAVINDDAAVPGLRIPTTFTPDDYSLMPPAPKLSEEADRVVVVLLADDQLVNHARTGRSGGITWGDYAVRLRDLCNESTGHRFLPVSLSSFAWPVDQRLNKLNFLRAFDEPNDEERKKLVARRMLHTLIRRLRPHPTNEDAPPTTIFLSHAKIDVGKQPNVVNSLLEYLKANQPEKTWFDSGDIAFWVSVRQGYRRGRLRLGAACRSDGRLFVALLVPQRGPLRETPPATVRHCRRGAGA